MAVTWKKVLAEGQVLSSDLATEGSSGEVLTTNGSGALSYTAKTVNTNQLTTWNINGGTASTINQGETVIFEGAGGTAVTSGGTDNRTITVTSTSIACPNTSASPTFSGTVTTANLTATGTVYMTTITAVQDTSLAISSGYQADDWVYVNGVQFSGSVTPTIQASRNMGAGNITCSSLQLIDGGSVEIGTGDDMKLYHDGSNSFITNAVGTLKIATETSGILTVIGHTTSETTIGQNLTVNGTLDSGAIGCGAITSTATSSVDGNFSTTGDMDCSSGEMTCGTLSVGSHATITGNLTVSGDTITQNVSSILVEDDEIVLLHNVANDTTDSGITFGMNTAGKQKVIGHDASANRVVVAGSVDAGALATINGFVATVETHATTKPDTGDSGSGIGSFWVEEDTNYLYVRVE